MSLLCARAPGTNSAATKTTTAVLIRISPPGISDRRNLEFLTSKHTTSATLDEGNRELSPARGPHAAAPRYQYRKFILESPCLAKTLPVPNSLRALGNPCSFCGSCSGSRGRTLGCSSDLSRGPRSAKISPEAI